MPKKHPKSNTTISSMTGYGRAVCECQAGRVTVEARSLNHRYLEVVVRVPRTAMYLDPEIRSLVKGRVSRGKVEIFVNLENPSSEVVVNIDRAREIAEALKGIAEPLGDKVRLEHVLAAGEITAGSDQDLIPELEGVVLSTAAEALDNLTRHRNTEGQSLASDIEGRMEGLSAIVAEIETLAPHVTDRVRNQITEFLSGISLGDLVDPQRLEVEIALLSSKSDISEEITRLKTHLAAFQDAVSAGGVAGRKMDFLLQEIQREINTIGAKSGLNEISSLVVGFKSELEKVREQVQNIE